MFGLLKKIFGTAQDRLVKKYRKVVDEVNEWDEKFKSLSEEELKAKTAEFKKRLQSGETVDDLLPEAYAVVKNACRRMIGTEIHVSGYDQPWDMIPYDVQVIGAVAMHKGAIAEMQTGEGKTLTAVMPLYLNALSGKPVHLVTVNDYLAKRDCQWVGTIFRWLGLTTGSLTNDVPTDERKEIYEKDIVYGTASEFGFDYLRDNSMAMRKEDQVQRGYHFAIIDEVDSILIDEARTPLIISGPVPESRQMYDALKGGVAALVRMQRDLCNKMATSARKVFLDLGAFEEDVPLKEKIAAGDKEVFEDACKKLWLVSKGTPRNKILRRVMEKPDIRAAIDGWDLYYYSDQNKQEKADTLAELLIVIDERANEYELTDKGIAAWEKHSQEGSADDFVMFDLSHEYLKIDADSDLDEDAKMQKKLAAQEADAERKERAHNLRQLLRAQLLMECDVDYIIQDNKIVIIDENTGRPQPGRRFSDGLHQAIEAKESVEIQKETQTYATITLQNFFRMYDKIAGMTGTAMTEAGEFKEIYKIDVLEIPPNRPCQREDANDEIYMTEREKYNAILKYIKEVHGKGCPILIGTESVEISEKLSRIFRTNKLLHTVLNARHHGQEAEIIAQAGRRNAITIATNMAGRGTDIKLGEGIADIGGLHVVGTTRHHSRRIDRQLRGRCARQGDPGMSKFYVSFEDSLMRLFASPKLTTLLQKFRPPEGEPIAAPILNRSIETAQKRIEQRNYTIRKHTLEYDDVMNKQRQEIYSFRNETMHSEDIVGVAKDLLIILCSVEAEKFFRSKGEEDGWDPEGYRKWLTNTFPVSFEEGCFDDEFFEIEDVEKQASEKVVDAFVQKVEWENDKIFRDTPPPVDSELPAQYAVRSLMLHKLDKLWQQHLLTMDHLRSEVHLRAVAQRDPLMEFKHEAFILFDELGSKLRQDIAHELFRFTLVQKQRQETRSLEQLMARFQMEKDRSLVDETGIGGGVSADESPAKSEPITVEAKAGRNDPCPCGSGKKYKKCCGAKVVEMQ